MKLPISWLNEYVKVDDVSIESLKNSLFSCGLEVEDIIYLNKDVKGIVVCQIDKIEQHPNADKLSVCSVNAGKFGQLQIVTNAKNIKVGDKVPVSLDGAVLADGTNIKKGKLRGVDSDGMFCGGEEIGITEEYYDGAGGDSVLVFHDDFEVGSDVCQLLEVKDTIFDVGVTANRPDCQSIIGLAREVSAVLNRPLNMPKTDYCVCEGDSPVKVSVLDSELCPRYVAQYVKDIVIKPSPKWMQKRLALMGLRAINGVVDITNYILLEMGQPMHAFDFAKLCNGEILVRRANEGENITTLDEKTFKLTNENLVICDGEKPVALAGIMGGLNSGITNEVQNIVFECAKFKRDNIRKSSRNLGQRSDSSARFEKGVDSYTVKLAMERALHLIQQLQIGKVYGKQIDILSEKNENRVISTKYESINKILGIDVACQVQKSILQSLYFDIIDKENGCFDAVVPLWREDVEATADLAEEVIRIYGYDHIDCRLLQNATITNGGKTVEQKNIDLVKNNLIAYGYSEIVTYSFVNEKDYENFGLDKNASENAHIKVLNPLSEDLAVMRTMLIPSMVNVILKNLNKKNLDGKLFEVAKVYIPNELPLSQLPTEKERICLGAFGEGQDFFTVKGDIETLLTNLNYNGNVTFERADEPYLHCGRSAKIVDNGVVIGVFGELSPIVMQKLGIDKRVYVAELYYHLIGEKLNKKIVYKPISKYPSVERDLALICDNEVSNFTIEKLIKERGGKNLTNVKLFDVYTGKGVDDGKKSMAYRLTFSSLEKTFGEGEVDGFIKKILFHLNENSITLR